MSPGRQRNDHEYLTHNAYKPKLMGETHENKLKAILRKEITNSTGQLNRNVSQTSHRDVSETPRGKMADSFGQIPETVKYLGQSQYNPHQVSHQPFVNMSSASRTHRKKRSQERYFSFIFSNQSHPKQILWVQIPPVSFGNFAHPHGCNLINQKQKQTFDLTNYTLTPINKNLPLPYTSKIQISDPTRDNWDKSRQRREKNLIPVVYEGPLPPPELTNNEQSIPQATSTSGGYTNTGSESHDSSDDDTKITDAAKQFALSDTTQTALWALGIQLETMGLVTVPPFQPILDITHAVKPLTQQFLDELPICDLGFEPPQAPTGGDELERTHRQAASIEDHSAREVALKLAMDTDNDFRAQLRGAETEETGKDPLAHHQQ
jgi:hypothetical protein